MTTRLERVVVAECARGGVAMIRAFGLEIHTEPPEFFAETIKSDFVKWGKLARDIGFKPR